MQEEAIEIVDRVRELVDPYLKANGAELIEIIYRREQPGMVLRLLVDTPGGITIDECEAINNYLSEFLDSQNVIEEHYVLEVSSPGLDRPIKTDRDFERVMGREITVNTFEPVDGKKTIEGTLVGMNKDEVVVESDGISTVVPRQKIAMARLKIEF